MFRAMYCLASVSVLPCGLPVQESPLMPKDPPLSWGTARVEGENLACLIRTLHYTSKMVTETSVKDGRRVSTTRPACYSVLRTEWRTVPRKDVRVFIMGGKGPDPTKTLQTVDRAQLPQLLRGNPRVLFAANGRRVESSQVKGEPEGSVVLVLPPVPPEKK